MAYASKTGALNVSSSRLNTIGLRLLEQLRMNLIFGKGFGNGVLSKIEWIVGTAVYQVDLVDAKSFQNRVAENLSMMTTLPPERKGDKRPARRPCTWKRGMTR